jgi:hypothetical protein
MSNERYPLPPHAAAIWLAGDTLWLSFESGVDGARGHSITIPLSKCSIEQSEWGQPLARQLGWHTLLDILRSRARAGYTPAIATSGAPSRYQIEGMLKAMKYDAKGRPAATTLADLGLEEEEEPST